MVVSMGDQGIIVTKEVLDLYDKYGGDFGMMDERTADKADLKKASEEQMVLLSEYVNKLEFSLIDPALYSLEIREAAARRLVELEKRIDPEVVKIVRRRVIDGVDLPEKWGGGTCALMALAALTMTVGSLLAGLGAAVLVLALR